MASISPKQKQNPLSKKINDPYYARKPEDEILYLTKNETKSLIIARYGSLECGNNFKGTLKTICSTCEYEYHHLNDCPKWSSTNLY